MSSSHTPSLLLSNNATPDPNMAPHSPDAPSGDSATASSPFHNLKRNKRKLTLAFLCSLFLAAFVATVATLSKHRSSSITTATAHAILHSSCAATRFPSLCTSAISSSPSLLSSISSHKDVILASLNLTASAVHRSVLHVRNLASAFPNVTSLADCLDMFHESLDEIRRTADDFRTLPAVAKGEQPHKLLADAEILVSAAMTNQESCLDGLSHRQLDRRLRDSFITELIHVMRMCSNALAMIKEHVGGRVERRRTMGFAVDKEGWPEWMGEKDRRDMAEGDVEPDAVVAADGSGDYRTVGEAVAAAPAKSKKRHVIRIKEGTYAENVEVPKKKTNIMFVGEGRKTTVITGSRNVKDGSTTFRSATLAVVGEGFLARGLRIENTAGPEKHQAVALRVGADLSAFYDCDIVGYQDTLYVHSLRQFFRSCLIQGTVDFIFGNAAAVLQDCDIEVRRPGPGQKNMVTASGREDPNEPTGIVIHRSRIAAAPDLAPVAASFKSYIGRPWKEYARTVVLESEISGVIEAEGWHEWDGPFATETLYYGEYRNTGDGAGIGGRVKWKGHRVIDNASEAAEFTPGNFIAGSDWLPTTGFPFSLGLKR